MNLNFINNKHIFKAKLKNQVVFLKTPTSKFRKKPDFIIIGAQKAGTTALYNYLSSHPEINFPLKKEIHFFDLNFYRGKNWYLAHFPLKFIRKGLTGEATPYYLFHPYVAERVYKLFPEVKLIIMLRNPVDRAFSHYQMELRNSRETAGVFEEALALEKTRKQEIDLSKFKHPKYQNKTHQNFLYLERGMYSKQISLWLKYFPANNIHFIIYEEFFANPNKHFENVCLFLDISKKEIKNYKVFNKGDYSQLNENTRNKYSKFYSSEKIKLEKLLNRKINWDV